MPFLCRVPTREEGFGSKLLGTDVLQVEVDGELWVDWALLVGASDFRAEGGLLPCLNKFDFFLKKLKMGEIILQFA